MHGLVPLDPGRLALSALGLLVVVAIARVQRLGIERMALVAAARGTAQLLVVGSLLGGLFSHRSPWLVLATLLVMLAVAARTAASRTERPLPGLARLAGVALATGTLLGVAFMTFVVVRPDPWYDPQYLVPFAGMLLGNAMNGASLAAERFREEVALRTEEIESRLALGLSGSESVHPVLARALRAAMMPTLNAFAVAGVVQLPGMMTGQILSGTPPVQAVKYQILIFVLLTSSTAASALLLLLLVRGRLITPAHQLRTELLG